MEQQKTGTCRSPYRTRTGTYYLPRILSTLVGLFLLAPGMAELMAQGAAGSPSMDSMSVTIHGQVSAAPGDLPLAGARVYLKGGGAAVVTDREGHYQIRGLRPGEVTIGAEFLGYERAEQTVVLGPGGAERIDFILSEEALALDGIVVTGTADQARRREVGNSIAQLEIADIAEPVGSVDNLLQRRTTSITVSPPGASFGAGSAIRLRGNVSLSLSNQPLIFVDGVRQTAESYPLNASAASFPHYGPGAVMSPLNDINPNDIERIEIVKGAAAATLYGSEASAGVIHIFTKKGRTGAPTWTLQSDHGIEWVQPFGSRERPYIGLDPGSRRRMGRGTHSRQVVGSTISVTSSLGTMTMPMAFSRTIMRSGSG